jgi:hypothetical protein
MAIADNAVRAVGNFLNTPVVLFGVALLAVLGFLISVLLGPHNGILPTSGPRVMLWLP